MTRVSTGMDKDVRFALLGLSDRTIQMWRVRMGYKANAPAQRERKENVQ